LGLRPLLVVLFAIEISVHHVTTWRIRLIIVNRRVVVMVGVAVLLGAIEGALAYRAIVRAEIRVIDTIDIVDGSMIVICGGIVISVVMVRIVVV
jgi:hypothetical protein